MAFFLGTIGNTQTYLGMTQIITGIVQSDNPVEGFLSLLGFDMGGEPEYSLHDLRDEMMEGFSDVIGVMDQIAMTGASTHIDLAKNDIRKFLANPDDPDTRSSMIDNAERALTATINMAETCMEHAQSGASIANSILLVTEALTTRMAVVELVENGAYARSDIKASLDSARAFFDQAADAYEAAHDRFIESDPVTVDIYTTRYNIRTITGYEFKVKGDLEMKGAIWAALAEVGVTPKNYVSQTDDVASFEIPKYGEARIPMLDDAAAELIGHNIYLPVDLSDSSGRKMLKSFIDRKVTEKAAEKAGFTIENSKAIKEVADVWVPLTQGVSETDQPGNGGIGAADDKDIPAIEGSDGNDYLNGLDYNDELLGHAGRDVVVGGTGSDTLDGGAGSDVLIGGKDVFGDYHDGHADVFVFRNPESVDHVKGFDAEVDRIEIDLDAFLDHTATSERDAAVEAQLLERIADGTFNDGGDVIYQKGGSLFFDADGAGDRYEEVQFAQLEDSLVLNESDTFIFS